MKYKFTSPEEMLDKIISGDLYCPSEGMYVFLYNDVGSICCYWLWSGEARKLEQMSRENDGEYWGAFLGVGGHIYDDPAHECFDPDWSTSNLDFCKQYYTYDWYDCRDMLPTPAFD